MLFRRRPLVPYLLVLFLTSLPAWAPWTRPGLPAWQVGALPIFQLEAMASGRSWDLGDVPARAWSYLLPRGLYWAGMAPSQALKWGIIVSIWLAGLSLYLATRRLWGDKPAVAAALMTLYAPVFLAGVYRDGALIAPWLILGASAWVWRESLPGWRGIPVIGAGLALILLNLAPWPAAPVHGYQLFEAPWPWGTETLDLHTPPVWSPGLVIMALALVSGGMLFFGEKGEGLERVSRSVKHLLLASALVLGVLLVGDPRAPWWLMVALPWLAVAAAGVWMWFPAWQRPSFWAALLIMPLLAAGPGLSPRFQTYPIPPQPAGVFGAPRILLIDLQVLNPPTPGQNLVMEAYWQATQPIDFDYNIFIHVVDAQGHLVAQLDTQPQQGKRPMTTWLPGEVLQDRYTLAIPAQATGPLHVEMGLYHWQTGQRLRLPDGSDALLCK